MHFAIRYLTEYRYREPVTDNLNALRVKPATTPHQRVDDFGVRVEPETRLHQHLDYYGTTVIEFGISKPHEQLAIDVRARVATTPPPAPPETDWEPAESTAATPRPAPSTGSRSAREPDSVTVDELVGLSRAATPAATLTRGRRADPGPLRVPRRRHLRRLDRRGPARRRRRRVPGLRAPRAGPAAPPRARRALRLRLPVRAAARRTTTADSRRGRHPRLGGGADPGGRRRASRSGSPSTRPTAGWPASTTSRSATAATTPTSRRSRASSGAARARSWRRRCA